MAGYLDQFRTKVVHSIWKDVSEEPDVVEIDDKIALGVLMWIVAEADGKLDPAEEKKIAESLKTSTYVSADDIPLLMETVQQAAKDRIDLHTFTSELKTDLPYAARTSILEELFRVACADKVLGSREVEILRRVAGLFHIAHSDFIAAKLKVKKEFGIVTAA